MRTAALAALCAGMAGCASLAGGLKAPASPQARAAAASGAPTPVRRTATGVRAPDRQAAEDAAIARLVPDEPVDVALPPQPLPRLVNTVFGDILKVPYVLGPDVAARTDVVALRSVRGMSKRSFFRLTELALKGYGLRVDITDGVVNVVSDTTVAAGPPPMTLQAKPDEEPPEALRQTSQLYEAKQIEVTALIALMTDVFPQARQVNFSAEAATNSVVVEGPARYVADAVAALQRLDQPQFSGASVIKAQPVYWSVDSLAASLSDSLRAEGYGSIGAPAAPHSVLVLAMPGAGEVLVFSKDPALLQRARYWIGKLDQPSALGPGENTFIYQVQNTNADDLAKLISAGGADSSGPARAVQPAAGAPGSSQTADFGQRSAKFRGGSIVVDPPGNRILFTGTAEDFSQLHTLLAALDTPLKEVLVEVTIAEVTLNDQTNLGLEWFFQHSMGGGVLSGGTLGGLGMGSNGLNLKFARGDLNAAFNTFASNNNVNILSRPRLVARTGSEAHIQVGTDVPIITSQINSPTSTAGSTDILQTIQYRQTGVILHIRPVVYGSDRVNLQITQEVSNQQPNPNQAIGSPLILNRNVTTELSLEEGTTAVLGGLIDTSYTKGDSGVPVLKDIPILGEALKTNAMSSGKTELIMLVTPYILRDGSDMSRWTERYASQMNDALGAGIGPLTHTLTPFGAGKELRIVPARKPEAEPGALIPPP